MGELFILVGGGGDILFYDMFVGFGLLKILMLIRVKRELEFVFIVELYRDSLVVYVILILFFIFFINIICINYTTL